MAHVNSEIFQKCDNDARDLKVALYLNDVHYYLGGWTPHFDCMMYISGIDFHCFPGHYRLPCNEGSYTVFADDSYKAKISMNTQGNS
jgi:hypothetical protein